MAFPSSGTFVRTNKCCLLKFVLRPACSDYMLLAIAVAKEILETGCSPFSVLLTGSLRIKIQGGNKNKTLSISVSFLSRIKYRSYFDTSVSLEKLIHYTAIPLTQTDYPPGPTPALTLTLTLFGQRA